jgi:hypothetical protein
VRQALQHELADAQLVARAQENRRARDRHRRVADGADGVFQLALDAAVEDPRAGVGSRGADEQEVPRPLGVRQTCDGERVVEIDAPERLLRSGLADRRPERAVDLIDAEPVGVRVEGVEIRDELAQLSRRGPSIELPPHERAHLEDAVVRDEPVDDLTADEARGADDESLTHRGGPSRISPRRRRRPSGGPAFPRTS